MWKELLNVSETITKFPPNYKSIVISSPIVRTDKKEANNILKKIQHFETGRKECHFSQQHFSMAFAQGRPALKFKWYNYASWKSFIKNTYVLI